MFSFFQKKATNYKNIDSTTLEKVLQEKQKIQLIDVRSKSEYQSGKIPGSKNLDVYDSSFKQKADALNKDLPTYVYCRSGARSASACQSMGDLGFKELYNLSGGIMRWGGKVE
jgi:rhodanese-related sulfurtransferase